jgi:hypothetical protein
MKALLASITTVAAATLALAVGATPVQADAALDRDVRRDVLFFPDDPIGQAAPGNKNADVTGSTIRYADNALRVKVKVRDLQRRGSSITLAQVRTPIGRRFFIFAEKVEGSAATVSIFRQGTDDVVCPRARARFTPVLDRVSLTVPAGCLGGPRWMKVAVAQLWSGAPTETFGDDARSVGEPGSELGENFTRRLFEN